MKVDFFAAGILFVDELQSIFRWVRAEEADEEFGRFDAGAFGEGICSDDSAEIGGGAQHDGGAEAEFTLEGFFDFLGQSFQVGFVGMEDDVAALDVGLNIAEF